MTTYMQCKLNESNQNLKTKKQGRGGWDDPTLAIPRKMRIVIKGEKKHVLGCVPCAQMMAVTSARPKMVAGNFRREK